MRSDIHRFYTEADRGDARVSGLTSAVEYKVYMGQMLAGTKAAGPWLAGVPEWLCGADHYTMPHRILCPSQLLFC